jgi:transcriptional regulator
LYQPVHFAETDLSTVHALIRAYPLGLLISSDATGIQANPVPFILDESGSAKGILRAHLARANPQWKHIEDGASVLVVFQGPDAYVTPSWYATKKEHGKVVPTWNYVMVQVRGSVGVIHDSDWLHSQISALTDQNESGRDHAWKVTDAPERYIEMQKRGIVGIEISIDDIRGKWKVSQNRSSTDQAGVAAGYENQGDELMAALVRDRMKL